MAIGQTFADILGGLVAINRGDPSGTQAFTKQGRAGMAQDRQNANLQRQMLTEVLQRAQQDPQYNAMLQQALAPYLQNEATRAGTEATRTQTAGQQAQNVRLGRVNDFFEQHGGSPESATFGLNQQSTAANVAAQGAQTQQTQLETQRALQLDILAQQVGYPNWAALQSERQMELQKRQLEADVTGRRQAAAGGALDNFYPDPSGAPSHVQKALLSEMGLNIPEDPAVLQRKQMADEAMNAVRSMREQKKKPKAAAGGAPAARRERPQQGGNLNPFSNVMDQITAPQPANMNPFSFLPNVPLDKVLQMLQQLAPAATDAPELPPYWRQGGQ